MQSRNRKNSPDSDSSNNSRLNGGEPQDRFADAQASTIAARREAMHDIELDADLSIHSPNDDLDEGETARLGEDRTDLI